MRNLAYNRLKIFESRKYKVLSIERKTPGTRHFSNKWNKRRLKMLLKTHMSLIRLLTCSGSWKVERCELSINFRWLKIVTVPCNKSLNGLWGVARKLWLRDLSIEGGEMRKRPLSCLVSLKKFRWLTQRLVKLGIPQGCQALVVPLDSMMDITRIKARVTFLLAVKMQWLSSLDCSTRRLWRKAASA